MMNAPKNQAIATPFLVFLQIQVISFKCSPVNSQIYIQFHQESVFSLKYVPARVYNRRRDLLVT